MSNNIPNYIPKQYFDPAPNKGNFYYNHNAKEESDDDFSDVSDFSDDENQTQKDKTPDYHDVSHFLIVNSVDRNWEDDFGQSQYNFRLNFAPITDQKVRKPLYQNNPTIPATNAQRMAGNRGDPNTSGWSSSVGELYGAYNASQPFGEIVEYEEIVEKCVRGANVKKLYKNVVSLEVTNVLVPAHNRPITYTSSINSLNLDSHLLLTIPEIEETIEGTNFEASQSFGMLIPYTTNYDTTVNDLKWHEYHTIKGLSKIYYPSPINTIPTLTFQLRNSLGKLLGDYDDFLDVKYIFREIEDTSDPRTDFLWIESRKFFHENYFQVGDKIIFRNYQFYNTSSNSSYHFNAFINREEGHTILEIDASGSQYLKNRIKISRPASYNLENGYLDEDSWYTTFKTLYLTDISDLSERTSATYDSGRLLNINLQVSYVMKVTTKEYNLDFLADTLKLEG